MQRAINLARGIAHIEILCMYPERFVNMCAVNGIEFWDLERDGNILRLYIRASGFKKLRGLSPKYGFEITRTIKSGAPYFAKKFRKRYVLIIGILLIMLSLRALALLVWDIRVYGNENIPSREILQALDELGFRPGTLGIGVSSETLSHRMLIKMPELSWFAVNIRGSRAEVLVRERIPAPELLDKSVPVMIVASQPGIVTKISTLAGTPCVKVGDTVSAGDILVTGAVADIRNNTRAVHALAEVEARTLRVFESQMPLKNVVKRYTDEKIEKKSINISGFELKLYFTSSVHWVYYDKITTERFLTLPGGVVLPVSVTTARYDEYEPFETETLEPTAENILKQNLIKRLVGEINGGKILTMEFETRVENGVMYVTLRSECVELINLERGFTAEELASAGL